LVLTDGGTFSTAADVCAIIQHLKLATFIGEETGGGHVGNNSGLMSTLTLPHSKIGVRFPFYGYWNAVSGDNNARRGTLPDHPVPMTTQDLLRGVDAPMELALKLARE
ncbi:MAG TPA: S41 family peptidase, partial [Tepidisphaeraceae bacterium]